MSLKFKHKKFFSENGKEIKKKEKKVLFNHKSKFSLTFFENDDVKSNYRYGSSQFLYFISSPHMF